MKKSLAILSTSAFMMMAAPAVADNISASAWGEKWAQDANKNPKKAFNTQPAEREILACHDCDNKSVVKIAREQFARGQYDDAIKNYNKVPRGTSQWLSAVEERGWAYFRQDEYEKALAQTKTLLAPQFAEIIPSEAFFLQSLTQLRICDYKGVFETHQIFKEKQKDRIAAIQDLAKNGWNKDLETALSRIDKFPLSLKEMGPTAKRLPLNLHRDKEFQRQAFIFKVTQHAMNKSQHAGVTKSLDYLNGKSFSALKNRVQALARLEAEENFKIVQRLNLIEVDAIQRVHTDFNLADEHYEKTDFKKVGTDKLVFMDDGRPWIDELDKYEVAAKSCQRGIRRKM